MNISSHNCYGNLDKIAGVASIALILTESISSFINNYHRGTISFLITSSLEISARLGIFSAVLLRTIGVSSWPSSANSNLNSNYSFYYNYL